MAGLNLKETADKAIILMANDFYYVDYLRLRRVQYEYFNSCYGMLFKYCISFKYYLSSKYVWKNINWPFWFRLLFNFLLLFAFACCLLPLLDELFFWNLIVLSPQKFKKKLFFFIFLSVKDCETIQNDLGLCILYFFSTFRN